MLIKQNSWRLLRETNLTLDKKLDIKKTIEQVDQQALDMTKVTEQADQQALETEHKKEHINKLNDQEKFKKSKTFKCKTKNNYCYRCESGKHCCGSNKCPAKRKSFKTVST